MFNKVGWGIVGLFGFLIGLYPLMYFFVDMTGGLLGSKNDELLDSTIWNIGFYAHISFGGVALAIGWVQFSKKLRQKYLEAHRIVGKIYVIAVIISAICGIYIGYYANGGIISAAGFISLGIVWFFTTLRAYQFAKIKDISRHEVMMYYSYAACFAAVMLRIWLPVLPIIFEDFITSYRIVSWLCWVPNLMVAFLLLQWKKRSIPV